MILVFVASGCSSSSSDEVAALEQRIAELEASTNTTAVQPTATSSSTSTLPTTTIAPTSTTIQAAYDLRALDLDTLGGWATAEAIDGAFIDFASESCENAVDALSSMSLVLSQALVLATGTAMDADEGVGTVAEAVAAFEHLTSVWPYVMAAAEVLASQHPSIGGAAAYAQLVAESTETAIGRILMFSIVVLDGEADEVDREKLNIFGPGLVESIEEFSNLGSRSWAQYCP